MKRLILLSVLFLLMPCVVAQSLMVEGQVINSVDNNGLPLCVVQLFANGKCMAKAVSDYAGRYSMPSMPVGSYDILVVQFSDTLCFYKGLQLSRDTWIRHYVHPPVGLTSDPTIDYSLGIRLLRPAIIRVRGGNILASMGLLINNPDDQRLWNFSGEMDPFEDLDLSFWWRRYKLFYKLRDMGYQITSPFELIYPEIHHPASDSTKYNYKLWILGLKF